MCELFGLSSVEKVHVNDLLKEFASHSVRHPNGWGLAVFYGGAVSLEKEPVPAFKSLYLKERLRHQLEARNVIAHIRLATVGTMDFENCHPFVHRDNMGRTWTLAHNGTIFNCPALDGYVHTQEGHTDSERILCHVIARVNAEQTRLHRPLDVQERCTLMDELVCEVAPHNKLNLLINDGELLYTHTNYANSLYVNASRPGTALFATVPLELGEWRGGWELMPFTTLCVWRAGRLLYRGTCHGAEYKDNPKDMKYIFADFAEL